MEKVLRPMVVGTNVGIRRYSHQDTHVESAIYLLIEVPLLAPIVPNIYAKIGLFYR